MREPDVPIGKRIKNLSFAAVAAQAGCATIIIVFVALFLGLWLDYQFNQRGVFTFATLLLSVPVSLFFMLRIALGAISLIELPPSEETQLESNNTKEV